MNNYDGVILEEINGKLDAMQEGLGALAEVPARLDSIDGRLNNLESDVKIIKQVVTGQSSQLIDHEGRITKLETA